ncbi:MAG: glycosyltransferase [Pseudomonadota bacterium]
MHILFVSDVYFPRINGVSTSIQTFAHRFIAEGHRVTLIAPRYASELEDHFEILRIPSRYLPFDAEDRFMKASAIRRLKQKIAESRPDIVHIQTPFVAHYAGLNLARALDLPVVETYHTYFEEYLENYLPFLPAPFLRFLARRFSVSQCNSVDRVIVPSRPMAEVLKDYGIQSEAQVIPTGIPLANFTGGDGDSFRQQHQLPADRPVLLFVGRVAFEKNIGFLFQVMLALRDRVPDALLLIAGEGPACKALARQAQRLGLEQQVRFIGYLSRDGDLADCYAAADAFVFASRTETQGLVLLEAMAAGTPVITTAVMGTADIMADGRGGLVVKEDAQAFAGTVTGFLGDAELRQRLTREALAKAGDWSDAAMARRQLELYAELVG